MSEEQRARDFRALMGETPASAEADGVPTAAAEASAPVPPAKRHVEDGDAAEPAGAHQASGAKSLAQIQAEEEQRAAARQREEEARIRSAPGNPVVGGVWGGGGGGPGGRAAARGVGRAKSEVGGSRAGLRRPRCAARGVTWVQQLTKASAVGAPGVARGSGTARGFWPRADGRGALGPL